MRNTVAAPLLQLQLPASLDGNWIKSTPDDPASFMLPHETSCHRRRLRDQSACENIEPQPSAKRRKPASHNYPPEFWDSLSKIILTRRALKELDRRTAGKGPTPVVRATRRSTRLLRSDTKKLFHFAEHGGSDLIRLRGYANLTHSVTNMSKSNSRKGKHARDSGLPGSNSTSRTSTTGPYDPQFQQMAIDNGVYPEGHRTPHGGRPPKPTNLNELRRVQSRTRPSLSPSAFSENAFEEFQDLNRAASSESMAMSSLIPIITGVKDRHCATAENKQFNNLEKFAPGLRVPQPDKYYGARPSQINETVRRDLDKYIMPTNSRHLPAAPNFFFEGKSAAGRPDVAQRQVMHDNAYGARAMFELQNYGQSTPMYDGNAYTIGSSYSDGQLKLYSTHPKQTATGATEYYMTQLDTYGMTGNIESFRRGAAAYRNSRDFTQEQRDKFIASANAVVRSANTDVSFRNTNSTAGTSLTLANVSFGSKTSADEPALNCDPASDESDGKARPRKRMTQAASAGPRGPLGTHVPKNSVLRRAMPTVRRGRRRAQNGGIDDSNDGKDEEHVTADGE